MRKMPLRPGKRALSGLKGLKDNCTRSRRVYRSLCVFTARKETLWLDLQKSKVWRTEGKVTGEKQWESMGGMKDGIGVTWRVYRQDYFLALRRVGG